MKKIKYKKIIYLYSFLILIIFIMIIAIYVNQRNTLINLRRNEMISIAKISTDKIKNYFDEKIDYLNNVFEIEDILVENNINIEEYIYEKIEFTESINTRYEGKLSYITKELFEENGLHKDIKYCEIGDVIENEDGNYIINIYKPIFVNDNLTGIISCEYLLDEVYRETLGKIQVGAYAYCSLKDDNGYILMHKEKNQIGLNSLSGRQERYPELNPKDIERLVKNQLEGKVGSDIVKTYWWGNPELGKVKKIIGYAPVKIGNNNWIVSATTSYDEIALPIAKSFYLIIGLGVILIILLIIFITDIIKRKNEQRNIIMELKHAEELNKATNKLRKHEENLGKINRIYTLGMVASTIAHEFKNLLTPIFIYTEMMSNYLGEDKDAIQDLEEIKVSANNCLELSQSLLSYSKDEVYVNNQWFNSCEEINNILNILKAMLPKKIKINKSIDSESINIYGSKREFKQVVLNICTNAYQAMESSGGIIDVEYYAEGDKGILTIKDNGDGIDDEKINEIFEPFYTSKAENGTGLGLSIVVKLLKNLNGTIVINSKKSVGTTVKIEFYMIKR